MWYIVHGLFKAVGLEYLGEEAIWRLAVFMAVAPVVIVLMLIFNEGREVRKKEAERKVKQA